MDLTMKDDRSKIESYWIKAGAKFESFKEFETCLERWKTENFHPFRVASSETLRMADGSTNETFKYRYIVYHCAHYGTPRMRGVGKRPNQNYMPCGCRAMLRLNYSWTENALRVTTLNVEHTGHEVSANHYARFASKTKRQCLSSPPISFCKDTKSMVSSPSPNAIGQNSESPKQNILANLRQLSPSSLVVPKNDFYPTTPNNFFPLTMNSLFEFLAASHQQNRQNWQSYSNLINNNHQQLNNAAVAPTSVDAVDDARTDDERFTVVHPVLQNLTDHLLSLKGREFDERVDYLKMILGNWVSSPTSKNGVEIENQAATVS